ncbi:tail fiber domain-containing protein [Lacrimispora sp.]|uniref:tail fiber domain-containing protein n=1 Tax=Lacrimispora sp. TaxID=2719234 RepID=UPI0028A0CAD3|nr:tail fiber domain-containing protein [Lacrimispora sp.]
MLNIPEELKLLFRADNLSVATQRYLKLRFYDEKINFPENVLFHSDELFPVDQDPVYVIENSQIISESLTIEENLCASQDLAFGECNSSQLEIIVADVLIDLTGKEFIATVDIGGYELAIGIYKVDSFVREQADRRRKKIVAYDRMLNFDIDVAGWYQGLTFPLTLKQFRDSLCEHIGVTQVTTNLPLDDMRLTKTIDPEQLDGRKVLMAICEINGCFGNFDKTGRLTYKFLGFSGLFPSETLYPSDDLFPSEMTNAENLSRYKQSETYYEDFVTKPINKVQIRQEEGDVGVSYGPGKNCYIIQGNFLVYGKSAEELPSIAATVYEQISMRIYKPSHIVGPALPWVEVGDGIICYTTDDVIETYCFKRTMKGIQGMMDTYESQGSIEREQSFGLGNQIIQLEGKTAIIKKSVEEVSVRVSNLKESTEAQFAITANQILAEVTRAKQAEASLSVKADQIALSVTNLTNDTNSRFTQTAEQIALKVSKGQVSSQLSLESDKVTISGNRLIVNSTNFQLDGDGNATFSGRVQGAQVIGSSISGGSINIGGGTFWVDSGGNAAINAGQINLGSVSINQNYSDLGAFKVSNAKYGAFYSANGEIELVTTGQIENNPMLKITKNGVTTVIGYQALSTKIIDCNSIYLHDDENFWSGWSLTKEIKLLHNKVFGTNY